MSIIQHRCWALWMFLFQFIWLRFHCSFSVIVHFVCFCAVMVTDWCSEKLISQQQKKDATTKPWVPQTFFPLKIFQTIFNANTIHFGFSAFTVGQSILKKKLSGTNHRCIECILMYSTLLDADFLVYYQVVVGFFLCFCF